MSGPATQALLAGCGALAGAGCWTITRAILPDAPTQPATADPGANMASAGPRHGRGRGWPASRAVLGAVVCGIAVAVVIGWPAAAVLAGAAALVLPRVLGPDRADAAQVARGEAVAGWTEMLRDTLAGAAGLEHAIFATAPLALEPLTAPVHALAEELHGGQRLRPALDRFADRLADPGVDLVVAALRLAAAGHARDLTTLLGALAGATRDQVGMRLRLAAGRARVRTTVRVVLGSTLALAAFLVAANRRYLSAYNTASGQAMLLAVGALFALGLWWLDRMSHIRAHPRLWPTRPTQTPGPDGQGPPPLGRQLGPRPVPGVPS